MALLALWGYRRYASSMYVGTAVKALVALYLVALIVLAVLTKQGKTGKLLPETAERLPVYISCGLSAVALLAALAIPGAAYYAIWAMAAVIQAALILLIRAAPLLRSGSFFTHGQKVLREGCPQKQRKRFGKTEGKRRYSRALSVKRKKRRFLTAVAGNECIM